MAETLTPYQKDILIRTVLGEARGEGVEGMADVAQVIFNRAASGRFPSDPAAVALQPSQFSTWLKGKGGNNPGQFSRNSQIYKKAAQAVEAVAAGVRPDPTGGALFYHTPAVTPNWRDEVNQFGTVERNGHIFYPTSPTPPQDIPSVASLLSVAREAPTPAVPSVAATALRQITSPSGGNTQLQSALETYATRERNRVTPQTRSQPNLTSPGAINASVQAAGSTAPASLAAALQGRVNSFNGDPLTPSNGSVVASIPTRSVFGDDPMTPVQGGVVASIPTRKVSASDLARGNARQSPFNGDPLTPSNGSIVASIPTTSVGQKPATRVVQSVPMPPISPTPVRSVASSPPARPISVTPARSIPLTTGVQQSFAGQDRAVTPRTTQLPTQAQLVAATGFTGAIPERLPTGFNIPNTTNARGIAGVGTNAVAPIPFARPSTPSLQTPVPTQVASQLSVTPVSVAVPPTVPKATAPTPIFRPSTTPPKPSSPLDSLMGMLGQTPAAAATAAGQRIAFDANPLNAFKQNPINAIQQVYALPKRIVNDNLTIPLKAAAAAAFRAATGGGTLNPVGTILGTAANGGTITQGHNGLLNSLTQSSSEWQRVTGNEPRYTDNGSGTRTDASGGKYYDRNY